jgi:hypothetical protein
MFKKIDTNPSKTLPKVENDTLHNLFYGARIALTLVTRQRHPKK